MGVSAGVQESLLAGEFHEHRSLARNISKHLGGCIICGPEPNLCIRVIENLLCPGRPRTLNRSATLWNSPGASMNMISRK